MFLWITKGRRVLSFPLFTMLEKQSTWEAVSWGSHPLKGPVTSDTLSQLLARLKSAPHDPNRDRCHLRLDSTGLTIDISKLARRFALDQIVFCHMDSAWPDAIVWVVRDGTERLQAIVFRCQRPGAALAIFRAFNDLYRTSRMNRQRPRPPPAPVVAPERACNTLRIPRSEDSYTRLRAKVVAELQERLQKQPVDGATTLPRAPRQRKPPEQRRDPVIATTSGGVYEKRSGSHSPVRRWAGWPVGAVVKKLLLRRSTAADLDEEKPKRTLTPTPVAHPPTTTTPMFWSPPVVRRRRGVVLLPVLPPAWGPPHPGFGSPWDARKDSADPLVPYPRSVMKKHQEVVANPRATLAHPQKKNVKFNAFATVQMLT